MNKRHIYSHVMSWILSGHRIPKGKFVLHKCDVRNCVNPSHLWIGTLAENNADRDAKGRHVSLYGDAHPSRLHPEKIRRGNEHHARLTPWVLSRGDSHYSRRKPELLVRGERHGLAKLTSTIVLKIRKMRETGQFSLKEIAKNFGVCRTTVGRVVNGTTWMHVP